MSQPALARRAGNESASLQLYDDALQTLETLAAREIRMAVVTNLPARLATLMTDGAGLAAFFDTVVTPRPFNGIPAKPSARGVYAALRAISKQAGPDIWFVR